MAEAALAMSLDDLIKNKKKDSVKKAPKAGVKGGASGGGGRGTKSKGIALGVNKGGVGKGGKGGRGKPNAPAKGIDRPPKRDPDANGKWVHDMWTGGKGGGRGGRGGGGADGNATLYLNNLAYNVTTNDIKDLVEDYKTVVKCMVNYDRSGRSTGSATVVFASRVEAERCKRRYTNMALDGKVMELELGDGSGKGGGPKQLSSGIRLTPAGGAGGGRRGGAAKKSGNAGRAFQQAFQQAEADHSGGQQRSRAGRGGGRPRGRGGRGSGNNVDLDQELHDYMEQ